VLLGLNQLWKLGLSRKKLCALGAKIGSDVPFFVMEERFAEARGRGEILKPLHAPGVKLWHVIVKPSFGISTKMAYGALKLSRLTPATTDVKMHLRSLENGVSGRLSKLLFNSLEVTENKQLISIHKIKKQLLEAGALASLMSGSGSAVFGLFRSHRAALKAMKALKKHRRYKIFTAATF
jgi:4-diphosphocytidyl-2-C-methyl-D-erythritol kinase